MKTDTNRIASTPARLRLVARGMRIRARRSTDQIDRDVDLASAWATTVDTGIASRGDMILALTWCGYTPDEARELAGLARTVVR